MTRSSLFSWAAGAAALLALSLGGCGDDSNTLPGDSDAGVVGSGGSGGSTSGSGGGGGSTAGSGGSGGSGGSTAGNGGSGGNASGNGGSGGGAAGAGGSSGGTGGAGGAEGGRDGGATSGRDGGTTGGRDGGTTGGRDGGRDGGTGGRDARPGAAACPANPAGAMCAESGSTCQAEIGGMRATCFCFNRQWRCPGVDPTPTPRPDGGTQTRPVCGPEVMDDGACRSAATPFCISQPDGGRAQICICERDMWNCRR